MLNVIVTVVYCGQVGGWAMTVGSRDGQNDSFPGTSSFSSVHYNDSFI